MSVAAGVGSSNGIGPVSISYSTIPAEERSVRGSAGRPKACSGAM
jgi:hypothetical protein